MSLRRSSFEHSIEVLACIHKGENKPTRIMYDCNLSWNILQEILQRLLKQELIIVASEGNDKRSKSNYYLTDKGMRMVQYLNAPEFSKAIRLAVSM